MQQNWLRNWPQWGLWFVAGIGLSSIIALSLAAIVPVQESKPLIQAGLTEYSPPDPLIAEATLDAAIALSNARNNRNDPARDLVGEGTTDIQAAQPDPLSTATTQDMGRPSAPAPTVATPALKRELPLLALTDLNAVMVSPKVWKMQVTVTNTGPAPWKRDLDVAFSVDGKTQKKFKFVEIPPGMSQTIDSPNFEVAQASLPLKAELDPRTEGVDKDNSVQTTTLPLR